MPATAAGLEWDALEKSYEAKEGESEATLTFSVTNRADHVVEIRNTAASCSCTVATPPRSPWMIQRGATETLKVTMDLRGRVGRTTKTIYVDTSEGEVTLQVTAQIPMSPTLRREMNMMRARADRQAVLRGDCASCHVTPTIGKRGAELFQTACVICHTAEHRASFVPDLMVAKVARDAAYWEKWIREGAPGTLMPAFAEEHGGPLDDEQIASLVAYLVEHLPTQPGAGQ
ncbi:MAG TPA: DUF1573 domain-containing protein [Opitutus sp.]|nr:DUF1573 domain-containing protein [Opitutus sp.]